MSVKKKQPTQSRRTSAGIRLCMQTKAHISDVSLQHQTSRTAYFPVRLSVETKSVHPGHYQFCIQMA